MRLCGLLSGAGIEIPRGIEDVEITGIATDSRKVEPGGMFICIYGLHTDGHKYIANAVDAGAAVIVAELGRDVSVGGAAAIIMVENTRRAAALLYNSWYGVPARKMKIIAVTGTNGKTSVTYMLKAIYERALYRCGIIGTVGCESAGRKIETRGDDPLSNMTTPDPSELYRVLSVMADDGVDYVFLEATSHASALSKLEAIHFDTLIFTNLTQDHLDFHGDMNSYFAAKAHLFSMCDRAVINADDKYGVRIEKASAGSEIAVCSCEKKDADFFASDVVFSGSNGVGYTLVSGEASFPVTVPIPGYFTVINSLEAAACALCGGISPRIIASALSEFGGVPGRMESVPIPRELGFSVFIDYAHTPDAMENLLRSARGFAETGQRIVILFGCGGDRDRSKRKEMAHIASRLADSVIVTSDNSRSEDPMQIISDIMRGIDKEKEYAVIPERKKAIEYAVRNARRGDIILLAGKGHEAYEIDGTGRHPFDEKQTVTQALGNFGRGMQDK